MLQKISTLKNLLWFRMTAYIILGTTVPLIVFAIIATWHTRNTIYEQTTRFSTELVDVISRNIQREIHALQITSIDIAYSDMVQNLALNHEEFTHEELQSALLATRVDIARRLTFNLEVTDVLLYLTEEEGILLYGNAQLPFRLSPEYESYMISYTKERNGRLALFTFGPDQLVDGIRLQRDITHNVAECLMLSRAIRSLPEGDILGVLVLRLNTRFFNQPLRNINVGDGVEIIVYNQHGFTMLTTNEQLFTTGKPLSPDLLTQLMPNEEHFSNLYYDNQSYLLYSSQIEQFGWTVAILVPSENLERELRGIVVTFMLILATTLLLAVVVLRAFQRIFNRPMIRLTSAMNAADAGSLDVEVKNVSPDEIGQATRSFNNMLKRIRQLLADVKAEERAKHDAQLAALQAQINPHFLSNTLGVAKVMAQNQKADNIDDLLTALIDLLHISMGARGDMIPLKEEMKYVQSYVEIMRYRNYAGLEVSYHIQEEAKDCLVPKLILQPLVENALIHGINLKGRTGQIDVRAVLDGANLYLTVTDNGEGISKEKIESIMSLPPSAKSDRFSGIALPNVRERIHRLFGNDYGLHIDSIPNVFTTVEIVIPIQIGEGSDAKE